ncbi:hypothetical protein F0562_009814 [Nyssa sinensis]|uniref:Major facilitator superfamily (MFS) profile domain-containing protein n=1 Tax=Nyssa sinensis TaxID=561372 RepID=A0A5J5A1U8_9ASTE|nr:hypothetical protein F0562_009814 [Nyssa sinensis]
MADSTLFLPPTDSGDSETPRLEKRRYPSLDDTIERCIGDFGWAQFSQAVLVSFAWFFDAQQVFISIFSDTQPTKWHCTQPSDESCNSAANICQLPKNSWAWDLPAHTSVVSEWSLECAGSIITGLPASSFFIGCLVGGLVLATLADSSLGRKNTLLLSCLLMALPGVLTIFSTNIWTYSALRFLCGFGRATIGSCALVLSTELVGKRWRGQVGIIGFFGFMLGWLYVRGRRDEFVATLKSIAPANYRSPTISLSSVSIEHEESTNVDLFSAIKMLLEKSWAIRRLSAVMVVGFGIGVLYYGMPLALENLSFNLYLSVTFNALAELPSSLITFFLIGRLNRKSALLGFTIISGICSVLCAVMRDEWTGLQIGLELVSFFCACTASNVLLIYTLELFPTCVRNSAMSMARQALVLGGVFSPVLAAAGRENGLVSYGVFGVAIGCCGLSVAWLPETRGGTLCDTIDEEEHKETEYNII